MVIGLVFHLLLLFIFFRPFFYSNSTPEEIRGILVSFDAEQVSDQTASTASESLPNEEGEILDEAETSNEEEAVEISQEVVQTEESPSASIDPIIQEKNQSNQREEERNRLEEEKREAERLAQQKKKEAEEKAAFESQKKQFGNLFGNNQDQEEGEKEGDDQQDALEQLTSSTKKIEGGLRSRGVLFEPNIEDQSQRTGVVVMEVCVNRQGRVVEAKWTQRGSTTTDNQLISIAKDAALQYRFEPSDLEKQCGSISIQFEVK
jgi:hypothetical protein